MLSIRDYLILLITNTSHKAHLLSYALRCSSKLQEIQSLENFVLTAIQGIQVPIYTKTHCLCTFLFFQFFIFLIFMKRKIKEKKKPKKKPNKNIKKHTDHKTRLTQNKKAEQTSNA